MSYRVRRETETKLSNNAENNTAVASAGCKNAVDRWRIACTGLVTTCCACRVSTF